MFRIVMMGAEKPDISARTQPQNHWKNGVETGPIFMLPNLGKRASTGAVIKINAKYLKKTLARILGDDSFDIVLSEARERLSNKTG